MMQRELVPMVWFLTGLITIILISTIQGDYLPYMNEYKDYLYLLIGLTDLAIFGYSLSWLKP